MTEKTPDLSGLLEEQQSLELSGFDYDFIWELGRAPQADALPVAIEIGHANDIVFTSLTRGATM